MGRRYRIKVKIFSENLRIGLKDDLERRILQSQPKNKNATMKSCEPHEQPPEEPGDTNNFTKEDCKEEQINPIYSVC